MDYEKLGFMCGIEIHQQLETHKLYCECPSIVHDKDPDIFFSRKLRAVAGETGKVDAAASHEKKKDRIFNYQACTTSSCLVEMDEEPPHPMNKEALEIGLQAAHLFNAKVIDEIQVMRKTVVDGSNVSGFQRTALIAVDGYIDTSKGKINIPLICLEEEAAKKVTEDDKTVTFRLDRLGVPLIEVSTDAGIKDPDHAKECAEKIGMILRSTSRVKRGIGTIRQDVNVSIKGGVRTEIKGFQDLKSIPDIIIGEISRQQKLLKKGEKVKSTVRKAEQGGKTVFLRPMPGSARMYPETDILPVIPSDIALDDIELIDDKVKRYGKEFGLGEDLAKKVAKSAASATFEKAIEKSKVIKGPFIAETLISAPREIRRKNDIDISNVSENQYLNLFALIDAGKVPKGAILDALVAISKGKFNKDAYKGVSQAELKKSIAEIVKDNPDKPFGALMGMIMAKFSGKVDGKVVSEIIKEQLK